MDLKLTYFELGLLPTNTFAGVNAETSKTA